MEKISRKVKCSDQLPKIHGWYYIDVRPFKAYFNVEKNEWQTENEFVHYIPEYWYEEVDLEELAKERYEKAVKLANELVKQDFMDGFYFIAGEDIPHILKVAAGLQEE